MKLRPEENWTKCPNAFMDNLPLFTPAQVTVLVWVIRQNIGYQQMNDRFSISYLARNTGMSEKTIKRALPGLVEMQILHKESDGPTKTSRYFVNWEWSAPVKPDNNEGNLGQNDLSTRVKMTQGLGQNDPQLKKQPKRKNTKKQGPAPVIRKQPTDSLYADCRQTFDTLFKERTGSPIDWRKQEQYLKKIVRDYGGQAVLDLLAAHHVSGALVAITPQKYHYQWDEIKSSIAAAYKIQKDRSPAQLPEHIAELKNRMFKIGLRGNLDQAAQAEFHKICTVPGYEYKSQFTFSGYLDQYAKEIEVYRKGMNGKSTTAL